MAEGKKRMCMISEQITLSFVQFPINFVCHIANVINLQYEIINGCIVNAGWLGSTLCKALITNVFGVFF